MRKNHVGRLLTAVVSCLSIHEVADTTATAQNPPAATPAAPTKRSPQKPKRLDPPLIQRSRSVARSAHGKTAFKSPLDFPQETVHHLTLRPGEFRQAHGPDAGVPSVFHLLSYNGERVGRTIRVHRGEVLRIRLKNDLAKNTPIVPPGSDSSQAPPSDVAEQPHGLNVTNLHTHGLHVTPADPGDNIFLCKGPQEEHEFTFHIPKDHPAGTFWYHPHNHGSVAYQLSNGVSGALIVQGNPGDGIADLDDIPEIAKAEEQIIVFQLYNFRSRRDTMKPDLPGAGAIGWIDASTIYNVKIESAACADVKIPAQDQGDHTNTISYQVTAINGVINPTFSFKPGELKRWRLIHAGWDQYRKLQVVDDANGDPVDDFEFMEVATDGLAVGRADPTSFKNGAVELGPGQRSDVLIRARHSAKPGVYHLHQLEVDPSSAPHGTDQQKMYLATIEVGRTPLSTPMEFPKADALEKCRPFPDIPDSDVTGHRSFLFSANDPGTDSQGQLIPPHYTINGKTFHKQDPIEIPLGTVEEWTINVPPTATDQNLPQESPHPFHIHVNPFQIQDGPSTTFQRKGIWRDTLLVKPGESYKIRHRFLHFTGRTVFHCHILDHEDQGMMVPIYLTEAGRPLPPQFICKDLRPPATKLTSTSTPASRLKLPDTEGVSRGLTGFRQGNIVLVFFQGIECIHCGQRLRELVREARGPKGFDAEIVAVSSQPVRDRREAFEWLGIESKDRFSLLVDERHDAFREYGCYDNRPQHGLFVIDRSGVIRARYVGESPFDNFKDLTERVRQLGTPSASMPSGPQTAGSAALSDVAGR